MNKNNLTVNEYINIVNAITNLHFDEQGNYTPEAGRIGTMCLFHNLDVSESEQVTDMAKADAFIRDKRFIKSYNKAINTRAAGLNFGNAYKDAMAKVREALSTTAYMRHMTAELTQATATGGDA